MILINKNVRISLFWSIKAPQPDVLKYQRNKLLFTHSSHPNYKIEYPGHHQFSLKHILFQWIRPQQAVNAIYNYISNRDTIYYSIWRRRAYCNNTPQRVQRTCQPVRGQMSTDNSAKQLDFSVSTFAPRTIFSRPAYLLNKSCTRMKSN